LETKEKYVWVGTDELKRGWILSLNVDEGKTNQDKRDVILIHHGEGDKRKIEIEILSGFQELMMKQKLKT
jgi:uncharacterized protein YpmB